MKNIRYQLALLFIGWGITTLCLLLILRTVRKSFSEEVSGFGETFFKIISVFIGFGIGWWFKGAYLPVLKFLNQATWGVTDPVFNQDISFYVFTLPFLRTILTFIAVVSGIVLVLSFLTYGIGRSQYEAKRDEMDISSEGSFWGVSQFLKSWPVRGSIITLTVVGAVFTFLGRYSYLWEFYPGASVPTGASYMAVNYLIPYTWVRVFGVLLLGYLVFHIFSNVDRIRESIEFEDFGALKREAGILVLVFLIFLVIPGAVFGAINTLNVKPNEPGIQQKYVERTIRSTNRAYGLGDLTEVPYSIEENDMLTSGEALDSPTVRNARIVDYRPTIQAYQQKQRLKLYYEFPEIDVDRYGTENGKKLTVISGREIDTANVPSRGGRWQNNHLIYTHGFGAVLSSTNEVQLDGSPILAVKNIPPVSDWENTTIRDPRIYFGEETNNYALVGAENLDEFDYPKTGKNAYNRFPNSYPDRGINLGNLWKKLVAWFYTGDFNILVSNYVGEDSKLLLHRNVHTRVKKIAPFLRYDSDAHFFIDKEGSLNYLLNGITHARNYPYSYTNGKAPGYLSDSVKSFVSANSGRIEFYTIQEDPIVQTFSNIYPGLFKDETIPPDYRNHLFYPNDLFTTQMGIYRRYHMKDYRTFYQQESFWSFSEEVYHGARRRVEAYNLLFDTTELQGFKNHAEEFMLVKPFTPKEKHNLTAWVGVGQDGQNYGKKVVLNFPEGELTRGPRQVEAIISQDTDISRMVSLWGQRGSRVLRGNLLALPVKDDILYIEPLYLTAADLGYPQLKRVIAVHRDRAVMENTLRRAVLGALGEIAPPGPGPGPGPGDNVAPPQLVQLVKKYLELSRKYNRLIAENNFAEAGIIRENMLNIKKRMRNLTG